MVCRPEDTSNLRACAQCHSENTGIAFFERIIIILRVIYHLIGLEALRVTVQGWKEILDV